MWRLVGFSKAIRRRDGKPRKRATSDSMMTHPSHWRLTTHPPSARFPFSEFPSARQSGSYPAQAWLRIWKIKWVLVRPIRFGRPMSATSQTQSPGSLQSRTLVYRQSGFFNSVCQVVLEFAVGTSVAGRPPHRSVREALLHTAPTSGSSRKAFGSASRILSSPFYAFPYRPVWRRYGEEVRELQETIYSPSFGASSGVL